MLKQLKNNENGIVFVTVLMVIIVMAVLTVSMISLNVSQSVLAENESKKAKAETLAQGGLFFFLANKSGPSPSNYIQYNYCDKTEDVRYRVTINMAGAGINNTNKLNITVAYPLSPAPSSSTINCRILL